MRIHCARRSVKNSVYQHVWQKEPGCQCHDGPGSGEKARLDDITSDVVYGQVCCADTATRSQKRTSKENCTEEGTVWVDDQSECVNDVQVMRTSATACTVCQATEIRVCIGGQSVLYVTSTRTRVLSMKTPAQWHPQTHHIGDHSERKGNNGEGDDHATLHATVGKPVNAENQVRMCLVRTGRPRINQPRCKEDIRH
jgi:hypothetical protein